MAGGEQQTSLQRLEGGEVTDAILEENEDGATGPVDHGQIPDEGNSADDGRVNDVEDGEEHVDHEHVSGEGGSTDDGQEGDAELDGENSSYDGDLRLRRDTLLIFTWRFCRARRFWNQTCKMREKNNTLNHINIKGSQKTTRTF